MPTSCSAAGTCHCGFFISLVVLDVEGFLIKHRWFLVYRHSKRLSPAAGAFKDFVLSEAGNLLSLPVAAHLKNPCPRSIQGMQSMIAPEYRVKTL